MKFGTKTQRTLALLSVLLFPTSIAVAQSAACTLPGKDGITYVANSYYPGIGTASAGTTTVSIGSLATGTDRGSTPIAAGDEVLIIQMQGAQYNNVNTAQYGANDGMGRGYTNLQSTGLYEFAVVTAVAGGTLTLQRALTNTYVDSNATTSQARQSFQVIRVAQNSSLTLSSDITTPAWDGETGGVTVLDVAGTLNFGGRVINANGKGFRGGGSFLGGEMNFGGGKTDYLGAYVLTANTITQSGGLATAINTTSASVGGMKGEGVSGTPRLIRGTSNNADGYNGISTNLPSGDSGYINGDTVARGAPGNAGGGGTQHNAGGGGGGNGGKGGIGGATFGYYYPTSTGHNNCVSFGANFYGCDNDGWAADKSRAMGGVGGALIDYSKFTTPRLFAGGGGGAGDTNNGPDSASASQGSGGAGGGIIVIRAGGLSGSGTLNANGEDGQPGGRDSAGGGGAGGTVALDVPSGAYSVTINVKGGAGGNSGLRAPTNTLPTGTFNLYGEAQGPGGGGGGGFAILPAGTTVSSVNKDKGNAGLNVQCSNNNFSGTTNVAATANYLGYSYRSCASTNLITNSYGSAAGDGSVQNVEFYNPNAPLPGLCFPALAVTKTTSTPARDISTDTTATYTIEVTNTGGSASGVSVMDALPTPFAYNGAAVSPVYTGGASGPASLSGTGTTTVTFGTAGGTTANSFSLPSGAKVSLTFTVNLGSAAAGTYQNPASVNYTDPTRAAAGQTTSPGSTSATGGFTAAGTNYLSGSSTAEDVSLGTSVSADLQVTKTNNGGTADVSGDTLTAGSDALYVIRVTNNGPGSVTGAVLKDPAVSNLTVNLVACSSSSGNTCTTAPTTAQLQGASGFTLPTLASGAFFEIEVTGRVASNVGGTITNVATVTAPNSVADPNTGNNSASDSDTIVSTPPAANLTCDIALGEVAQTFTLTAGSWTSGSTSNAASPFVINVGGQTVQMTINLTNNIAWTAVGGVQSPALYTTGNTPNSLLTAHDSASANQLMSTFNLVFSRPIDKLQFSVKDVDFSSGNWQDRLVGRIVDTGQQAFDYTGTANCLSDNSACNYPASSGSTTVLTGYAVDFYSGPSVSNPANQFVAYNDFSWCALVPVLTISKAHSGNFAANTNSTYTLTITNSGKVATSGNITVQDLLPTGMTFQSVSSSAGTVTGGAVGTSGLQTFTVSGTNIAAGGSLTLTVTVKTPLTATAQNVTNYASVGGGGDPDATPTPGTACTSNQCASDPTTINAAPQADLAITKSGPSYAKPGETVTYTIKVWNNGPLNDPNASVTDTMPTALTNVSWSCTPSGTATCGTSSGTGNISLSASLPVDATTTTGPDTNYLTIAVTGTAPSASTLETTAAARSVTNTANVSVGSGLYDLTSANNSASATTNMLYAKLVKSVRNFTTSSPFGTTASGQPGQVLEYCIDFYNYSGVALPSFEVADDVPSNTNALLNAYGSGQSIQVKRSVPPAAQTTAYLNTLTTSGGLGSGVMTANLGTLLVGETGSVCFQATIK